MKTSNNTKSHVGHGFNQFELTKNLINNLSQFKLTPTAKLVMIYLSTCYNPNKADIYPKQKTIASKIGISERSIVRAIEELVKAGLILKECNYTNRYKITSRILREQPQNEKFFNSDKVSETKCKNDTLQSDKLAQHEQINQTNKEHDRKYLEQYAIEKGITNVTPYVNAIMRNGHYNNIIRKYKEKENALKQAQARREITNLQIARQKEDAKNAQCPLDFDKKQALEYVLAMPLELRNKGFCAELIKKYAFAV